MNSLKVKMTFTEEVLGMSASNPNIHEEYIASKAPDAPSREEEVAAIGVEEVVKNTITVFPRVDNSPGIWDYQMKGYFKDSCGALWKCGDTESSKITAYKKIISKNIFVAPRFIVLQIPEDGKMGTCQRTLRAGTPQGERISLANSETYPIGSVLEFEVMYMNVKGKFSLRKCIEEWLEYGYWGGFGQWRNSGKGRFTYEIIE